MKTGYSFGSLVSFTEALNAAAVKITGDQTIGGIKTFTSNPISSAAQGTGGSHLTRKDYVDGALALKAPLASPALTGTPTAPTAAAGTNTTQLATTAFVQRAIGRFEFIPIIANITVSSPLNYRFMAHAIAKLPSSGGSIRFIVDHSVDLTSGNCIIQAPTGETIVAPDGSDNQVRIIQVGREFVFVKMNNQWRVS